MATVRVYPVEGRLVRHPQTKKPIGAEGVEVDVADPFWFRRIDAGDVTTEEPTASADKPTRKAANAQE